MGTIASVLQWTCTNCNLINPIESLRCLRCGNIRRILIDNNRHFNGNFINDSNTIDDNSTSTSKIITTITNNKNNSITTKDNQFKNDINVNKDVVDGVDDTNSARLSTEVVIERLNDNVVVDDKSNG